MTPKQIDGPKLKRLREDAGRTQEDLSKISKVSVRTLQRAETGERLSSENAAEIAAALEVPVHELYAAAAEPSLQPGRTGRDTQPETDRDELNNVVLHKTLSARDVLRLLAQSYEASIEFDVEPTMDNVNQLQTLANLLEGNAPVPTPEWGVRETASHADKLRTAALLNKLLTECAAAGVSLFFGSYVRMMIVPRYDFDEGIWYTKDNWTPSAIRTAVLRVSDETDGKLVIRVTDKAPFFDPDDEIPF
ncbi:MAG: helix-turn-helix transcriptional regulator [Alphaproteobacteria bacterium]|nr:helix-turn-helix transcriptional regulator [Alphaproteobacteria bacterium]